MQSTGTRPPARRCCRADDVQTDGKHTRRAASPTSAGGRHRQHCRLCLRPDRIGGSVFLAPTLIAFAWASARDAAAISPPFILCNSTLGLLGALLAGQKIAAGALFYSVAAVVGAIGGSAIGLRWMSERMTRYVLTLILVFAALRMFFR